jgi:DNA polymerase-3 subunit delta'
MRGRLSGRVSAAPPILGNRARLDGLIRAADAGRMHHAYLFEGPEGVGKATFARWFARYLNCAEPKRPCGECPSCRQMLGHSHPDLIEIGPDADKATKVIGVDTAQSLIAALQLQRHSASRRVVIVDPADALNEEAANALLKTLEEPPQGTQFVLVTHRASALLSTVRSRCQRVRFGPVGDDQMRAFAAERGLSDELLRAAAGSPGRALRLAEGVGEERVRVREAILSAVGQPLHRLFAFTEAEGKKEDEVDRAEAVVDLLEEMLRDVAQLSAGRPERVVHADATAALDGWVRGLSSGGMARMSVHLGTARERLKLNVNRRTVLDALFSQLNLELR